MDSTLIALICIFALGFIFGLVCGYGYAQERYQKPLKRIVNIADKHPFNPIGHVIEHQVPEARDLTGLHR